MRLERINLETEYYADMIEHNGFRIENENPYSATDPDLLVNSNKFTDCEYRCECGAFTGRDIIGQKCPRCGSEILLHSLNFQYTGWIDIAPHHIIAPAYYIMLKRVLGNNLTNFILGNYKADYAVQYNENDTEFEENKKSKKSGRVSQQDINYIKPKIPASKHIYGGLGHDKFYERFEEIMLACAPKSNPELQILLDNKDAVFTSKIPIYSTAYRPVSKTSETKFYPKINKWFSGIVSICCKMSSMVLDIEIIQALNYIQNYLIEACEHLIRTEISKKEGFVRSEIVGGTFSFSGRSVITLDISLNIDEVDLPFSMVLEAYKYRLTRMLAVKYNMTLEQAYKFIDTYERDPRIIELLDQIIMEKQWIFILREPTNNLASIALCTIRHYKFDDDTISLPVEPLAGYNADFDGDQLDIGFLDKNVVEYFEAFHYSCMTNYVKETIDISLREWCAVSLGRMSE